jgi:hypothetical protein
LGTLLQACTHTIYLFFDLRCKQKIVGGQDCCDTKISQNLIAVTILKQFKNILVVLGHSPTRI